MSDKLRNYQVLDVLCKGTLYKVRHKTTNNIFAWKAFDCSVYSSEQTGNIIKDVKNISKLRGDSLLHYYDTILHIPSKTLYFVLEFNSWRSVEDLITLCRDSDKLVAESFVWYLLYELARVCKVLEELHLKALRKSITIHSVFLDDSGALKVNCFELTSKVAVKEDLVQDIGDVIHSICFQNLEANQIKVLYYSQDVYDVVGFLTDKRNSCLKSDIVLYHPTVLANLEITSGSKRLNDVLLYASSNSQTNKCDSEKAVELRQSIESTNSTSSGPTYANIDFEKIKYGVENVGPAKQSLSPTIAALALELPGFVPRSRQPISEAIDVCQSPQKVSERTLSHQWMSRLIALRQREESLNKRERDLISKEIVNSPCAKAITFVGSEERETDGITLPSIIPTCKEEKAQWVSRRRQRSSSVRSRRQRKSYGYEDINTSLSADPGDESMIITATKFTKENMPRRNIFPEVSTKRVHFTSANPFVESDESVTLTFYELDNVDIDGYQMPKKVDKFEEISKYKYIDLEKTSEKRLAMTQWTHSSPSKQPKTTKCALVDITNEGHMRKTPSKSSLVSKTSSSSKSSLASGSVWSSEVSKVGNVSERTRSSVRCSLAPQVPQIEVKQKMKGRKSLLNFKTPFKFMASSKV